MVQLHYLSCKTTLHVSITVKCDDLSTELIYTSIVLSLKSLQAGNGTKRKSNVRGRRLF